MQQPVKIIEFCFTYRDAITKAVAGKRADPGTPKTGGSAGNAQRSDPTCQKALRNIAEVPCVEIPYGAMINGRQEVFALRKPERWLRVIDLTMAHYQGRIEADLATLQFTMGKSREEVCGQLCISRSLYFILKNELFSFATGVAAGLGLVTPRR